MTPRVILACPSARISGVDVFSMHLVRELNARHIPAHILLTGLDFRAEGPLPFPSDVPTVPLAVSSRAGWRTRWRALIDYLEANAPCIYIPNYDFDYSCVSPQLSERVTIVGIAHSDDPVHYAHVQRLGKYWNAIVAVSPTIAKKICALEPTLAARVGTIPYGVPIAEPPPRTDDATRPLRVVYAGRLVQEQKRVFDLAEIMRMAWTQNQRIELAIIGAGRDEAALRQRCESLMRAGAVQFLGTQENAQVLEIFARSDVFLLTSEYEGLPVSLLEAMGRDCVPLVTDLPSGIPNVIEDGVNGFRVQVGDIKSFAARLNELQMNPQLRFEMGKKAYATVAQRYTVAQMVDGYVALFESLSASPSFTRPRAPIRPPPSLGWRVMLPGPVLRVLSVGGRMKRYLPQLFLDGAANSQGSDSKIRKKL